MTNHIQRAVGILGVVALFATACGTQLDDETVAAYAAGGVAVDPDSDLSFDEGTDGGQAAGPSTPGTPSSAPTPGTPTATPGTTVVTPGTSGDGGEATGGDAGTDDTPDDGAGDTGGGDTGGGDSGGGTDPGTGGDGGPAADTRSMPAGGNGGATDTGVTEDRIVIYNVSDRTGAVPGLFQDAQEAVAAYVLKFQSTEGTVYGRQVELVQRDSKMSTQENRAAYLDACNGALAAVGSMSAFEQGVASPVSDCSIPDLRTAAVSPEVQVLPTVVSIDAMRPDTLPLVEWQYYLDNFPDAVTKAGYLWIDNATTTFQTQQTRDITTSELGYNWIHEGPIALSEVNYASVVQQLKDKGVELVAFQGAAQQAARIAKTMEQQNYSPTIYALQSNVYVPSLIEECGQTCETLNVVVGQTGALVEEMGGNPEMQEYATWLARVNPRAVPTGLGLYAWSSAQLFFDALKAVGPNVTRAAVLEHARSQTAFTGNGLIPEQNLQTQDPTDCIIILEIEGGAFTRVVPSSGYLCGNRIGTR